MVTTAGWPMVCHYRKNWVTGPGHFHAYCYVERQFDPAAARKPPDLAQGVLAGDRLPAGDQVHRRGLPAAGDRIARLQRRLPRPEDLQRRRPALQTAV